VIVDFEKDGTTQIVAKVGIASGALAASALTILPDNPAIACWALMDAAANILLAAVDPITAEDLFERQAQATAQRIEIAGMSRSGGTIQ